MTVGSTWDVNTVPDSPPKRCINSLNLTALEDGDESSLHQCFMRLGIVGKYPNRGQLRTWPRYPSVLRGQVIPCEPLVATESEA